MHSTPRDIAPVTTGEHALPASEHGQRTRDGLGHAAWAHDLGAGWRWFVAALALLCALTAFFMPLIDPDLPMHLRIGTWIVEHGRVPFTEPFAWTRHGAPFFAYSWLAELLMLGAWSAAGLLGLHLLHAAIALIGFLAVIALGRTARWTPWATLLVALLAFLVSTLIAAVRPHALLQAVLPLAWYGAARISAGHVRRGALVVLLVTAFAANVHLLFPLLGMAIVIPLSATPFRWRHVAWFVGAMAVGAMLTPYALSWPSIFMLNFTGNAMVGAATSIAEMQPGFRAFGHLGTALRAVVVLLLILPACVNGRGLTRREWVWYLLCWAGGLALFGMAVRGLVLWFMASLPLLARVVAEIPPPADARVRRLTAAALLLIQSFAVLDQIKLMPLVPVVSEQGASTQLPVLVAPALEPIIAWLSCNVPAAGTAVAPRTYTVFNYGNYLLWRIPGYSLSVDGRAIFPDSVATADAYQLMHRGPAQLGPWRSAELAILPKRHALVERLRADTAWQEVRVVIPHDTTFVAGALWARRVWLDRAGVPQRVVKPDTVRPGRDLPAPCTPRG